MCGPGQRSWEAAFVSLSRPHTSSTWHFCVLCTSLCDRPGLPSPQHGRKQHGASKGCSGNLDIDRVLHGFPGSCPASTANQAALLLCRKHHTSTSSKQLSTQMPRAGTLGRCYEHSCNTTHQAPSVPGEWLSLCDGKC